MARIAGVDLPREKQIQISLTYLYGIGTTTAQKICAGAQLDPTKRISRYADVAKFAADEVIFLPL